MYQLHHLPTGMALAQVRAEQRARTDAVADGSLRRGGRRRAPGAAAAVERTPSTPGRSTRPTRMPQPHPRLHWPPVRLFGVR